MADQAQVRTLRQGIEAWTQWQTIHRNMPIDLRGADLSSIDLSGIDLRGADLRGTELIGANLSTANLIGAYLSKADLRGADLRGADLSEAYLIRANLSRVNLSEADLRRADLIGVNLMNADLRGANLKGANLREGDLSQADLRGAYLCEVDLREANLSRVYLFDTIIDRTDLRTTKGLSTIVHGGPSNIQLFNVQLPQDGSALQFLRGAGIPDEWIDFWRTTIMRPIQYHSCFISYTSTDEILAKRLHADLQDHGVRCWFAPEDMKIGNKIRQSIDEAIHLQDKLLLILSRQSVESDWVEFEVETALAREKKERRELLFPVRIDESILQTSQSWARHLYTTRHIGNFTQWREPEAYQVTFERLLRDLKQT